MLLARKGSSMTTGAGIGVFFSAAAGMMGLGAVTASVIDVLRYFSLPLLAQAAPAQFQWAPILACVGVVVSIIGWLLKNAIDSLLKRVEKLEDAKTKMELAQAETASEIKHIESMAQMTKNMENLMKLIGAGNSATNKE